MKDQILNAAANVMNSWISERFLPPNWRLESLHLKRNGIGKDITCALRVEGLEDVLQVTVRECRIQKFDDEQRIVWSGISVESMQVELRGTNVRLSATTSGNGSVAMEEGVNALLKFALR